MLGSGVSEAVAGVRGGGVLYLFFYGRINEEFVCCAASNEMA